MNPENLSTHNKWDAYGGQSPLINIFKKFHPLNIEIEHIVNQHTFPVVFNKNKFISSPVHRNKFLYLILKGVARGYMKEENKEITTWIGKENELVGSIRNLWEDEESNEYVQAIENIDAIAIPHEMSKLLYERFPIANMVGRKMAEMHYVAACERSVICRLSSVEKRYLRFLEVYPGIVNRVSLKYIASFLGVRLETLSRIRTKINQNKEDINY